MDGYTKFECQKTGECCKNLINEKGFGLMLFEQEAVRFSKLHEEKKGTKPKLKYVMQPDGKTKTKVILMTQLDEKDCPFLSSKNTCEIYEDRPLVCRAYPVQATGFDPARPGVVKCGAKCAGCQKTGLLNKMPQPANHAQAIESSKILIDVMGDCFYNQMMVEQNTYRDFLVLHELRKKGHLLPIPKGTDIKDWPVATLGYLCAAAKLPYHQYSSKDLDKVKKEYSEKIAMKK